MLTKSKLLLCISLLICLWIVPLPGKNAPVPQLADVLLKAHHKGQKIPVLSLQYPDLDIKTAYQVQKVYAERRLPKDKLAGFKAGLTTAPNWKRFGLEEPVAGILFATGKRADKSTINAAAFNTLMIETEIGFVIGKSIHRPLKDAAELKDHTREVLPVIELPDLGFVDMKKLTGPDIIAANIGSAAFILGQKQKINDLDIDNINVTLKRNQETVNRGKGTDAFSGQWKAALWLVNTMVKQGWKIEPGHIIITGALGQMIRGKPGNYTADYGNLGVITFEINTIL